MKIDADAKRVTIYVNNTDQWQGRPLHTAIIQFCQEKGIAGATASRAIEGYGAGRALHVPGILSLGDNLPVRIEIIDRAERIDSLLPALEGMIGEGLVALSDVRAIRYLPEPKS